MKCSPRGGKTQNPRPPPLTITHNSVVPPCRLLSPHGQILKKGSGKQQMLVSVSYGGACECDVIILKKFKFRKQINYHRT